MNLKRNQSGQALVLTVVFLVSMLGMSALVLDVGSWYRSKRNLQATADSAALAGAQALPDTPSSASGLAGQYAQKNASDLATADYSVGSNIVPNDQITVHITRPAPGFFAKLFGIDSVNVGATATAESEGMAQARYVAPITVRNTHPMLAGPGCPCYGPQNETTLPLGKTGAPGAFDLIDLNGDATGTVGASTLADWIQNGYGDYLGLGDYFSDPGAKWNNSTIQAALQARFGTELLFPVYDTLIGSGSNAKYHIIAWAAFHLESVTADGSSGSITGYFTDIVWDGIAATTAGGGGPNFGVHTVQLID